MRIIFFSTSLSQVMVYIWMWISFVDFPVFAVKTSKDGLNKVTINDEVKLKMTTMSSPNHKHRVGLWKNTM